MQTTVRHGLPLTVAALLLGLATTSTAVGSTTSGFGGSWQMSESGGTRVNDTRNDNDGSFSSDDGLTLAGGLLTARGRGNVTIPHRASLNPGSRDFSFGARFRITGGYLKPNIMQKGQIGHPGGYFKLESDGDAAVCFVEGSQRTVFVGLRPASGDIADGQFHSVHCRKTAAGLTINVDGRETRVLTSIGHVSNDRRMTIAGKQPCGDYTGCDRLTGQVAWAVLDPA